MIYWVIAEITIAVCLVVAVIFLSMIFSVYSYFDAQFSMIKKIAEQEIKPPRVATRFDN